jgi:hypothetical protein
MAITINGTNGVTFPDGSVQDTALVNGYQVFTSSGTFNVPSSVTKVKVTVIGAGGNGGTASGTNVCSDNPGGGGGAGGYLIDYADVTAGGTATVTVGTNAGSRTSSFSGLTSVTAGGGNNGSNAAPSGFVGLSGASTIFGVTNYTYGPSRTSNGLAQGAGSIVTSGSIISTTGGVYAHGFGIAGSVRSSSATLNAKHTPIGFGAGAGGGLNASGGVTTGGIGNNGLVIVEW